MNMFHAVIIDDYFVDSDSDHFGQSLAKIESHGTACAKIFQAFSSHSKTTLLPVSSKFEEEITIKKLVHAIKQAREFRPDLLVMSMGTTNPLIIASLTEQIQQVIEDGVVLLCACSNENVVTYPASLPSVFGVRNEKLNILPEGGFSIVEHPCDGIDIISSFPDPIVYKDRPNMRRASNSLTTQYVGAIVSNIMIELGTKNRERIYEELKRKSIMKYFSSNYYEAVANRGKPADGGIISFCGKKTAALEIAQRLVFLFAEDGYCVAIAGQKLECNISKLHFSLSDFFSTEGLSLPKKISLLFRIAKIDLLLLLPDVETYPADIVISVGASNTSTSIQFVLDPDCTDNELELAYRFIRRNFE